MSFFKKNHTLNSRTNIYAETLENVLPKLSLTLGISSSFPIKLYRIDSSFKKEKEKER